MRWAIGILAAAIAAWVKSLTDRAYVAGYSKAVEDAESQHRMVDRQIRNARSL